MQNTETSEMPIELEAKFKAAASSALSDFLNLSYDEKFTKFSMLFTAWGRMDDIIQILHSAGEQKIMNDPVLKSISEQIRYFIRLGLIFGYTTKAEKGDKVTGYTYVIGKDHES